MAESSAFRLRTVVVWGASGGIGRALVERLVSQQIQVFACTRSPTHSLQGLVEAVIEANPTDAFSVQQAILEIAQLQPRVDAVVYCPGDIEMKKSREMQCQAWQRVMDVNLNGAFLVAHHSLPLLPNEGRLVFIGAQTERLQLPGMGAYVAAKVGLEFFAATLAKEERKQKIAVLRPGAVATPFWDKISLRLPKNAHTPAAVAERLFEIIQNGESGSIDF